jgi:hypothetical protein
MELETKSRCPSPAGSARQVDAATSAFHPGLPAENLRRAQRLAAHIQDIITPNEFHHITFPDCRSSPRDRQSSDFSLNAQDPAVMPAEPDVIGCARRAQLIRLFGFLRVAQPTVNSILSIILGKISGYNRKLFIANVAFP